MRALTPNERRLLDRFRSAVIPSQDALAAQLDAAEVAAESAGFLELAVPRTVPPIASSAGLPLDGWYEDRDGGLVSLILHVTFPDGRVATLERYRPDGEPIVDRYPEPDRVTVQAHLPGGGKGATFDPVAGWKPLP